MSEYIVKVEGQTPDAIYERQLEEIVRCRDCKNFVIVDELHSDYDDYPIYGCRLLKLSNARIDDEVQEPQGHDGFCAWGTRRGE